MSSTEYIGSKRLLLDFVVGNIERKVGRSRRIADVFSGTGVVSAALKERGFSVAANDHLATCFVLTSAKLLNSKAPPFNGLDGSITSQTPVPYHAVIKHLNAIRPKRGGFIHKNYSPASASSVGFERRYFTEDNAAKIDSVRARIEEWKPLLTEAEEALLLNDLLKAVSAVSNVAGTYGCYLKQWKARALAPLVMTPSAFGGGSSKGHKITSIDALQSVREANCPTIYADPPYTKRQYAAYYHLLETIVRNDNPKITGSTGLRNWETHSSDFCYKRKAEGALSELLSNSRCDHFFLSYNDDGQIAHKRLLELLRSFGKTSFAEHELRRYKSSNLDHKGPVVTERIYHVAMT